MFLNLLISVALASPLLIKAPEANPHEFFVYAQNNESEKISNHFTKCDLQKPLERELKEAQFHFLNSSIAKSREIFKGIIAQKWNCDWKDNERQIVAFSFFRLAQMSDNEMEQIQLLTDAINFDFQSAPDDAIFPPPLVKLYKNLKSQLPLKTYSLPAFASKYSYVLRNGEFIALTKPVLHTLNLRARYTFVSDAYKVETRVVTPEELAIIEIEPQPWVTGSCDNPQLDASLSSLKDVKVYFNETCIADVGRLNSEISTSPKIDQSSGLPETYTVSTQKTWLQRNYLWVGAAVIGSLVLIHQMNKEDPRPAPVATATYTPAP